MMRKLSLLGALLFLAVRAFPVDYGVVLSSQPILLNGEGGEGEDAELEWTGRFLPWFSSPLGDKADLYLSGGLALRLEGDRWEPLPEVGRLGLAFRPLPDLGFEFGRFASGDPLGFVLSGTLDGLSVLWNLGGGRLRTGAFFTGLLYKRAGYIIMNDSDLANHYDGDRYFASRRLAFSLSWQDPSLLDGRSQLDLALLAQFDLNGTDDGIQSQYFLAQWSRPLWGGWYLKLGAALDLEERAGAAMPGLGFALSLSPFWSPPKRPGDRLFLTARLSSGNWNDTVRAFRPISIEAQGRVLRTRISGLAWTELGYSALLHRKLEAEITAAWFFRTDRESFFDPDLLPDSQSLNLGGEAYGSLSWVPASFCKLTLGGGVFVPSPAGAYDSGAPLKWRVTSNLLLSF